MHYCRWYKGKSVGSFQSLRHGYTAGKKHPIYTTWVKMRQRCNNPKHIAYSRYGGRGIKVCARWDNFALFLEDMGERPKGLTLDRKNNDGDYTPDNCRWATNHQQAANRKNNNKVVGVCWSKSRNRWMASLTVDGKLVLNKGFSIEYHAINARRQAEKQFI